MLESGPQSIEEAPARDLASPVDANNIPHPSDTGPSHTINSMIASAVWWLVAKYSGSTLSWLSRFFYGIYCNWLIGGATGFWGNVKWFFVCMQPEEDVSNYSYSNSQQLLGILSAGGAYWVADRFQRFWYRAGTIAQAGATIIEQDLRHKLEEIHINLEKMAISQQSLNESSDGEQSLRNQLRESQLREAESQQRLRDLQTALLEGIDEQEKEFSSDIARIKQKFSYSQ